MLPYRPLVFFWIAEYEDGKAVAQFDPDTGEEKTFALVQEDRLIAFGWYPFKPELSGRITKKSGLVTIATNNPSYRVKLEKGDKLIAKRENVVRLNIKGEVVSRETAYILGKVGGKILRICEDGSVE
ncbi:MAG TPA: hypothetical protein VIH48_00300 [Candidatus Bathyarchaeia archaeon]